MISNLGSSRSTLSSTRRNTDHNTRQCRYGPSQSEISSSVKHSFGKPLAVFLDATVSLVVAMLRRYSDVERETQGEIKITEVERNVRRERGFEAATRPRLRISKSRPNASNA